MSRTARRNTQTDETISRDVALLVGSHADSSRARLAQKRRSMYSVIDEMVTTIRSSGAQRNQRQWLAGTRGVRTERRRHRPDSASIPRIRCDEYRWNLCR